MFETTTGSLLLVTDLKIHQYLHSRACFRIANCRIKSYMNVYYTLTMLQALIAMYITVKDIIEMFRLLHITTYC